MDKKVFPRVLFVFVFFLSISACAVSNRIISRLQSAAPWFSGTTKYAQETILDDISCPESFQEQQEVSKKIHLTLGGRMTLKAGSNPSMPCSWDAPEIGNPEVITQIDHDTEWPAEGVTPKPGAPGTEFWIFEARGEGQTVISLPCHCLDDQGEEAQPQGTLEVQIRVKK
ncbi:MAG: protease inhibitor I42 family protein [Anaerolineales bacterium]